jgi:hypothetical protein
VKPALVPPLARSYKTVLQGVYNPAGTTRDFASTCAFPLVPTSDFKLRLIETTITESAAYACEPLRRSIQERIQSLGASGAPALSRSGGARLAALAVGEPVLHGVVELGGAHGLEEHGLHPELTAPFPVFCL